jgi:hypothetical protein
LGLKRELPVEWKETAILGGCPMSLKPLYISLFLMSSCACFAIDNTESNGSPEEEEIQEKMLIEKWVQEQQLEKDRQEDAIQRKKREANIQEQKILDKRLEWQRQERKRIERNIEEERLRRRKEEDKRYYDR